MQNRNDEPRLQHAPLRLPRKDGGRGRVNRRAMGVGRVSEWRKVTSQNPAATSDSLNQRPRIEQSGRAATMNADHHTIGGYFSRCPAVSSRVIVIFFSSRTFSNTVFNLTVIFSLFIDVSPFANENKRPSSPFLELFQPSRQPTFLKATYVCDLALSR